MIMDSKLNKVFFVLIITAIIVSIIGTLLVINAVSSQEDVYEDSYGSSGVVSLNIKKQPQEYSSTGFISLDVISGEEILED
jgi:hypothetical protein